MLTAKSKISEILPGCNAKLPSAHLSIMEDILDILDREGHVPSIYQKFPRATLSSPPSPYSRLAKISLRDHSIHVARKFRTLIDHWQIIFPLGVIASLGHDIGKVPRLCNKLSGDYTMVKHARAGAVAIERLIDGRLSVRETSFIVLAIRHHHDRNADASPLLDLLRRADCLARDDELIGVFTGVD